MDATCRITLNSYKNKFYTVYESNRSLFLLKGNLTTGKIKKEKIAQLSKKKDTKETFRTTRSGPHKTIRYKNHREYFTMKKPGIVIDSTGTTYISYSINEQTFLASNKKGIWKKHIVHTDSINSNTGSHLLTVRKDGVIFLAIHIHNKQSNESKLLTISDNKTQLVKSFHKRKVKSLIINSKKQPRFVHR